MRRSFSILATMLVLGTASLASAQTGTTDANNQIVQTDPNTNNTTNDDANRTDDPNTIADDTNRGDLPETATPLPLAMIAGAGLAALGFWMRRRRRR